MALPSVAPLSELTTLDRRLLHMFVAGPGEGEGLALALPESGWVLVDGCRSIHDGRPDAFPLERIWRDFRAPNEAVELMVLTHPHRDHFHGFAELIETVQPKAVALTGVSEPLRTLASEVLRPLSQSATTSERLRRGAVSTVLRAIDAYADRGGSLIALHDGITLHERATGVRIDVRAPDESLLQEWFEDGTLARRISDNANWLSAVLEVKFGKTIVVLGADLPVTDKGVEVPTGWEAVIRKHQGLLYHLGLKIPHHGSREALHTALIGRFAAARAWCLTPFNSSSLPRTDDEDGLDMLLKGQSPVMLTAMSLSKKLQVAHNEERVTPATLGEGSRQLRKGGTFQADDTLWRTGSAIDPLDAVWCVAFDAVGGIVRRWRGRAAIEVHAP